MNLFEQIVMAVNEELGISNLVTETANNIISMIVQKSGRKLASGDYKSGSIGGVNIFGKKIDVYYTVYYVKSINDVRSIKCTWPGGFNDDLNRLQTTIVYVEDEDRYIDYTGTTQHEVEHIYQTAKNKKNLIAAPKTKKIYVAAKNLMSSRDFFEQVVGYSVYYANKFEGDGYANTYYKMISDDSSRPPMEIVQETTVFKNLKIIENVVERDTPYARQAIENVCMDKFGKHFNWWRNLAKRMLSNYFTKIGKVIAKVEKERQGELVDPNKAITHPPKFIKDDE